MNKPFWQSKTLWFNGVTLVGTYILSHQGLLQAAGLDTATVTAVVTVINLLLRLVTKTGVGA